MARITASLERTLAAPAAAVYTVLADYRRGHPRILPEQYFSDLVVLQGGTGAGTEIEFNLHVMGTHRVRARIEEPEPGRILKETAHTGAVTTFRVLPAGDDATRVAIVTAWETPGLRGLIEGALAPRVLRRVYAAELELLEKVARMEAAGAAQAPPRPVT